MVQWLPIHQSAQNLQETIDKLLLAEGVHLIRNSGRLLRQLIPHFEITRYNQARGLSGGAL